MAMIFQMLASWRISSHEHLLHFKTTLESAHACHKLGDGHANC